MAVARSYATTPIVPPSTMRNATAIATISRIRRPRRTGAEAATTAGAPDDGTAEAGEGIAEGTADAETAAAGGGPAF